MEYLDYDVTLTDEQCQVRDAAHAFAAQVLRPAGIQIDAMPPEQAIAPGSPLFGVLRQAGELGYTKQGGSPEIGGMGLSPLTRFLVLEELAWGNVGLAAVIFFSTVPADATLALHRLGLVGRDLVDEFALPAYACDDGSVRGCWAITEPDHGSDSLTVARPGFGPNTGGQLVARRSGDEWILSGQKAAWVSNAPLATHVLLNALIDSGGAALEDGIFLLPLDLPGITRGRPLDKHGVRTLPQGELFFDEVRVPARYMVLGGAMVSFYMENHLAMFNAGVGCSATGLARAAYESALGYCKERVQGGRPIVEHQSVRARLFRMFSLVQACRTLSRGVWLYNQTQLERGQPARLEHSIASKVFTTQAALEVATLAVQLHGGSGVTKEYPVEMFLRDATAFTIADGENAFLTQIGASYL
jgi:alkylation response protein AidB-like acyl-CoA dehydrogenase